VGDRRVCFLNAGGRFRKYLPPPRLNKETLALNYGTEEYLSSVVEWLPGKTLQVREDRLEQGGRF